MLHLFSVIYGIKLHVKISFNRVKVGRRKASKDTCKKCRGLYPKARVKRGQHWKWGDSNGEKIFKNDIISPFLAYLVVH